MTARFPTKYLIAFAALVLTAAAPLAQERLVINVGKSNRSASSSNVVHYQGTGSVRHSEQRTYEAAQVRHEVQAAQDRREYKAPESRKTVDAKSRKEVQNAGDRRTGEASQRGSVHLDTVR